MFRLNKIYSFIIPFLEARTEKILQRRLHFSLVFYPSIIEKKIAKVTLKKPRNSFARSQTNKKLRWGCFGKKKRITQKKTKKKNIFNLLLLPRNANEQNRRW
jgi:hypothetical protein